MLTQLSRAEITSCPSYGARIISEILTDKTLYAQWQEDLLQMSDRMKRMRQSLYDALKARNARGSWDHLLTNVSISFCAAVWFKSGSLTLIDWHVLDDRPLWFASRRTEGEAPYLSYAFWKALCDWL